MTRESRQIKYVETLIHKGKRYERIEEVVSGKKKITWYNLRPYYQIENQGVSSDLELIYKDEYR